jgi:hypothetical protein
MKVLQYGLLAVAAVSIAGCVTRERTVVRDTPQVVERQVVVRDPPPVQREVVVVDPHRTWWERYRSSEVYDRERALVAHRMWCAENPTDPSCQGWNWRQ